MANGLEGVSPRHGVAVLQFIWAMMVVTAGLMALAALFLVPDAPGAVRAEPASIALGLTAGCLFLIQLRLRRNLEDGNLFPRVLDLDSWGLGAETASRLKELRVPERGTRLILQAHVVFGIILWFLAEAVAFLALLLTFLTGEPALMAVFGTVALGELLWFRPRRAAFEKQLERWGRYVEAHRAGQGEQPVEQD